MTSASVSEQPVPPTSLTLPTVHVSPPVQTPQQIWLIPSNSGTELLAHGTASLLKDRNPNSLVLTTTNVHGSKPTCALHSKPLAQPPSIIRNVGVSTHALISAKTDYMCTKGYAVIVSVLPNINRGGKNLGSITKSASISAKTENERWKNVRRKNWSWMKIHVIVRQRKRNRGWVGGSTCWTDWWSSHL